MRKIAILFLSPLFGCTNTVAKLDSSELCQSPMAEAGEDQATSLGVPVILNGAASSWCEDYDEEVTFVWSFVSTPADSTVTETSLSANRTGAAITPQFTPDITGEFVVSLQVGDGNEVSSIDYVVVNVAAGDSAPISDCGGGYEGEVGSIVTIDGSASIDPEGAVLEYSWSLNTPSCSNVSSSDVYNEGTSTPSFVPDCEGTYAVTLSVSDGSQWSDPVVCAVDVGGVNRLPVADAGKTEEFGGCAPNPFELNGHSSYDADGDAVTYSWALVAAPVTSTVSDANFDDTTSATPNFSWDVNGVYTFQLQVHDGNGWSAPDLVDVTIGDIANNHRPIANAGDNMLIETTAACQDTSYSSECSDCPPYTLLLDGSGTMDLDADTLTFFWEEVTGDLQVLTPNAAVTSAVIDTQTVATSLSFDVSLEVSDCQQSDTDVMTITYTCVSDN
jgi:hypothetical protein